MAQYKSSYTGPQIDAAIDTVYNLADVATSGDYDDLSNKPSVPSILTITYDSVAGLIYDPVIAMSTDQEWYESVTSFDIVLYTAYNSPMLLTYYFVDQTNNEYVLVFSSSMADGVFSEQEYPQLATVTIINRELSTNYYSDLLSANNPPIRVISASYVAQSDTLEVGDSFTLPISNNGENTYNGLFNFDKPIILNLYLDEERRDRYLTYVLSKTVTNTLFSGRFYSIENPNYYWSFSSSKSSSDMSRTATLTYSYYEETLPSPVVPGTAGQVLTVNSNADGYEWATPASAPVTSVNSKTGAVTLTASDVGAVKASSSAAQGNLTGSITNNAAHINITSDDIDVGSASVDLSHKDLVLTSNVNGNAGQTSSIILKTISANNTTTNNITLSDGATTITGVVTPTSDTMAANKKYVDDAVAGVSSPVTDIKVNNTSILSSGVANLVTNTAYNASSNKIATMSDVPDESKIRKYDLIVEFELDDSTGEITSSHTISQIEAVSDAGGSVCGHMIYTETSDGVTYTVDEGYFDYHGGEFKQFAYDGWNYNYIYYDEDNSEWISDASSYTIDGNFRVNATLSSNGNYSLSIPGNSSPTFDNIAQYVSNSGYAIYLYVLDSGHFASGTSPDFYLPMTYRFASSSHPTNEMIMFSGTIFDGTDVVIRTIKLTRGSNGEYIVTVINTPTVLPTYNGEVS